MTTIYKQSKKIHQEKEMTDKYIITKELRDLVMYRLGNEGYIDLKWRIKKETESNPYNPSDQEKMLEVPLKALKSIIGLAFSFPQLPEEVRNQLIEVDNFYHKVKDEAELRQGGKREQPCKTPKDCEHCPKFTMDCLVNVQEHFKELRQEGKGEPG